MALRGADVGIYLVAAALPAILVVLYLVFRWRYLRAVERAIHGETPTLASIPSPGVAPDRPLTIVEEHPARSPALEPGLLAARREEGFYRGALAISGLVFVLAAASIVWSGNLALGNRAAVSAACWLTLPGVLSILVFTRRSWVASGAWLVLWLALGVLVHRLWLGISARDSLWLFGQSLGFVGPLTLLTILLAIRVIRPILVGLVALVLVWMMAGQALASVIEAVAGEAEGGLAGRLLAEGVAAPVLAGGVAAALCGISLAVWQIRRGLRLGALAALISLVIAGVGLGRVSRFGIASAIVTGIGFNGLVTVTAWWLFVRLVRLRESGHLPDEVLHYGFVWLGLTAVLPSAGIPVYAKMLPFAAFAVACPGFLRPLRRRAAARAPARLVLLRPFSNRHLRTALVDVLDTSWRRRGTVALVVGGDLAVRTVSGDALKGLLLGTVNSHFLHRHGDVSRRLSSLSRAPGIDGLYPLHEVHCAPPVWQEVVTELTREADVVLMDLRGMHAGNLGTLFELRLAVQRLDLSRVVLLVDARTDRQAVAAAAEAAWGERPAADRTADQTLLVLHCSGKPSLDNPLIVSTLFAALARGAKRSQPGEHDDGGIPAPIR